MSCSRYGAPVPFVALVRYHDRGATGHSAEVVLVMARGPRAAKATIKKAAAGRGRVVETISLADTKATPAGPRPWHLWSVY